MGVDRVKVMIILKLEYSDADGTVDNLGITWDFSFGFGLNVWQDGEVTGWVGQLKRRLCK